MMKIIGFILILLITAGSLTAGELVKFILHVEKERIDAPVYVSLDGIDYNTGKGRLVLYEITAEGETLVPCQVEPGHSARLWFLLEGMTSANTSRVFVLKEKSPGEFTQLDSRVNLVEKHKDLQLFYDNQPVLSYRFGVTYPPEGVNSLYRRSGYIHPLWSPGGEVLTRIQPPDHYHHYGIWGPWTKTHIDEREVDFWNLAKGQGTVRFADFLSKYEGEVFSGFQALQQHIDFGGEGSDRIAMNEVLDVRVWNTGKDYWIIDYTTLLTSPLENGIMLNTNRYGGGIGFRATEKWHEDNCTVLTSEGKTRDDADGTFARWSIVEGESDTDQKRSGILFLSHPANNVHPEPMHVWGNMFFQFTPIRHQDWKIEQYKSYALKYRMIVFDGELDAITAEKYWSSFASMPVVEFVNEKSY